MLQEDSGAVTTHTVQYETKLQLFMCNPSLVEEGNDAYQVDDAHLAGALSKVGGLLQVRERATVCSWPCFVVCRLNIRRKQPT